MSAYNGHHLYEFQRKTKTERSNFYWCIPESDRLVGGHVPDSKWIHSWVAHRMRPMFLVGCDGAAAVIRRGVDWRLSMRQNILFCEKRWYHEVISRPFIRTGFFYFTGSFIGEFRWDTLSNKIRKINGGFYDSIWRTGCKRIDCTGNRWRWN